MTADFGRKMMKHMMNRMRRILLLVVVLVPTCVAMAKGHPDCVTHDGELNHVQGIVWDEAEGLMYMSFTTRFVVLDRSGALVGSVDRIHGHLGAMTWDPVRRRVYASLECKSDEIGAGISNRLGVATYSDTHFFVAEINVDSIRRPGVPMEWAINLHEVHPAREDFQASVEVDGQMLDHRYGCSGIDGMAFAPGFGHDKRRYLYVAYGVYGDVKRRDNDYQVILRYPDGKLDAKPERFFVKTGNTTYGVQNMAYDPHTGLLLMAVYAGKKPQYPNYDLFAVDLKAGPRKQRLEDVPYLRSKANVLPLATEGWRFRYGSTGLCPLGDGTWYISQNYRTKDEKGVESNGCKAVLYRWNGEKSSVPFEPITSHTQK